MKILVTGGSGFIGSNYIRMMFKRYPDTRITNLDKLTYAGNPDNLQDITNPGYTFIKGDICDPGVVNKAMEGTDAVVHFAAESHVDRSIKDGSVFVTTNVLGTNTLLNCALQSGVNKFIHVSTDEVYGSIDEGSFSEEDPLEPSSPYSASKAGSDLLAMSYYITYGLPVTITRCTNNFGPYQYPEKLIPLFITNLMEGKKVPVYGTGLNVRDWIFVDDHCLGIDFVFNHGRSGDIYNIGGGSELTNLEITHRILEMLGRDESSIEFVEDRKGHDLRYSLDCTKLRGMGWKPGYDFDKALKSTVKWYMENRWWWEPLKQ
ncbi:MAG: dTDP-glucose 4,6-dehydratase [ANME-2 cluster archaeon]|nr:dTDP-glucose 4,6-dehydratase [ANME-2 cluster archaeon]MBC2702732.1 dTDP-glucose 4,6-dehydratase [ANME-2 cluster archaeon]MBC2706276.1 dTDP-glucose 4,6-dehydratase [ANME-2 cluster archaeon]MBC2746619.1 dTDP-glucose 4,6-dehydratase [ANME-2 cluster archaeon]MBC2764260.1 dTDP-glucose 4,6-dehydratase [ANME-2 cluster archaeon]